MGAGYYRLAAVSTTPGKSMPRPFTLAVFTKNRVNPAYDAARLVADRLAAEAGARTIITYPRRPTMSASRRRW